jgi:hypothetical protein
MMVRQRPNITDEVVKMCVEMSLSFAIPRFDLSCRFLFMIRLANAIAHRL